MSLRIENNGGLIVATDFWESDFARLGLFYLSINAGDLRLLVPAAHEALLPELATGKRVILSLPTRACAYAFELLFDDGSDSPFALHGDARQIDRQLPDADDGRDDLSFSAWTRPRRGTPHEALRRPAAFRRTASLPWLKPWSKSSSGPN